MSKNTVEALQEQLEVLKKAQEKQNSAKMRAEIEEDNAKKALKDAITALNEAGYSNLSEAKQEIERLEEEVAENLEKAREILGM